MKKQAFTLPELLLLILIIGVLSYAIMSIVRTQPNSPEDLQQKAYKSVEKIMVYKNVTIYRFKDPDSGFRVFFQIENKD